MADWLSEPDPCPGCGKELRYLKEGRPYSHVIGHEIPGVYDGVLYWQCPFCGVSWAREFGSVTMNYRSQQAVDQANAHAQTHLSPGPVD